MKLNEFAAQMRLAIFENLKNGVAPHEGQFDEHLLKEGRAKGQPQVGKTLYEPNSIIFEFVFPDPKSVATILQVQLDSPQRIVFMPVPQWVIEQIWQGEIDGSYQFESDAQTMLDEFKELLSPQGNSAVFGVSRPKSRE